MDTQTTTYYMPICQTDFRFDFIHLFFRFHHAKHKMRPDIIYKKHYDINKLIKIVE